MIKKSFLIYSYLNNNYVVKGTQNPVYELFNSKGMASHNNTRSKKEWRNCDHWRWASQPW